MNDEATTGETAPAARRFTADRLNDVENLLYGAVALALVATGAALFGWAIFDLARSLYRRNPFKQSILELFDALLLVFIVAELLHTVRSVIAKNVLVAEPFLVVGIVAAIRRIIVVTAEAPEKIGGDEFVHLLWEMGVLTGAVLMFGVTIFVLRYAPRSEPGSESAEDDQLHEGKAVDA
jgi:uncharacterized membrane protein (DUF373 family)